MKLDLSVLSVMGQAMVGHLLAAGHTVNVYNRTKEKLMNSLRMEQFGVTPQQKLHQKVKSSLQWLVIHPMLKRFTMGLKGFFKRL